MSKGYAETGEPQGVGDAESRVTTCLRQKSKQDAQTEALIRITRPRRRHQRTNQGAETAGSDPGHANGRENHGAP